MTHEVTFAHPTGLPLNSYVECVLYGPEYAVDALIAEDTLRGHTTFTYFDAGQLKTYTGTTVVGGVWQKLIHLSLCNQYNWVGTSGGVAWMALLERIEAQAYIHDRVQYEFIEGTTESGGLTTKISPHAEGFLKTSTTIRFENDHLTEDTNYAQT